MSKKIPILYDNVYSNNYTEQFNRLLFLSK